MVFIDHGRLTRTETLTGEPPRGGAPRSASRPRHRPGGGGPRGAGLAVETGERRAPAPSGRRRRRDRARGQDTRPRRRRRCSRSAPPPSSRSCFARRPRLDRDGPPVPASEVAQRRNARRCSGCSPWLSALPSPRREDGRARRAHLIPGALRPRRRLRVEGRVRGALSDDPRPPDPAHRLSVRPLSRDRLRVRRVLRRVRGARRRREGRRARFRRRRSSSRGASNLGYGILCAAQMAAMLIFFSTFLPGYGDVVASLLLAALPLAPDQRRWWSRRRRRSARDLLTSVDWERVFRGNPARWRPPDAPCSRPSLFLAAAAVIFSRREFAYGRD